MDNIKNGILKTYVTLINCREHLPGMKLEDYIPEEKDINDLKKEYNYLQELLKDK